MGKIVRLSARRVRPVQKLIEPASLAYLLPFFREGRTGELVPPAVREFPEYMALDGHTRLFLADLFGVEMDAYVPENKYDGMRQVDFPSLPAKDIIHANLIIQIAFEVAPQAAGNMEGQGIMTFADLRRHYRIDDLESLERFCRQP